jgi:hypothetical protein
MKTTNTTNIEINGLTLAGLYSVLGSLRDAGVDPNARVMVTHQSSDRLGATQYKMSFTWSHELPLGTEW